MVSFILSLKNKFSPLFLQGTLLLLGFMVNTLQAMEDIPSTPFKNDFEKVKSYLTVKNPLVGVQIYEEDLVHSSHDSKGMILKAFCYDLDGVNWLARGTAKDLLNGFGHILVKDFLRQSLSSQRYNFEDIASFYVTKENFAIKVAVMKPLYPSHLAVKMLHESTSSSGNLDALLQKYNGEEFKGDRLHLINEELGATKKIMLDNINKIIERGENLSEMQDKAGQLEKDAEDLWRRTKKLNSCCSIL